MGSFAVRLSETARTWGQVVAPIAEWVAGELWSTVRKPTRLQVPATRLTQRHKREARIASVEVPANAPPKPIRACRGCGASVNRDRDYCAACGLVVSTDKILEVGEAGRVPHKASRHRQVGLKRNGEMRSLSMRGKALRDCRSARKCMIATFSLGSPRYRSRQLQLCSPSLGHTLRIFADGDAARIHGIGKSSDGLLMESIKGVSCVG